MDKQNKASKKIHNMIVLCALGEPCDETELDALAVEYAGEFRCPYQLSAAHMRSLETPAEQKEAMRLEDKVNDTIRQQLRLHSAWGSHGRIYSELGSHGMIFRKTLKRASPKRASPKRASPKAASPKAACSPTTRRSYCNMMGGKRRTRINSKRRRS
jgi:hypothetical protein